MNFTRCCAFIFLLYISSICKIQSFDFDACPSNANDRLTVTYGSLNVDCSKQYDRESVTAPPIITFPRAVKEKFYEIVMIDPDAPSADNPKCRSWLHMILSDVKGSDLQNGVSPNGNGLNVVKEYKPPTPPEGMGYHRYILAAFSHAKPLNLERLQELKRCHFDIDDFTKNNNLQQMPDASNMFQTITK